MTPQGVRVLFYDDKCAVSEITNLPFKATWEEKGKTYQGCWGPRPDLGVIAAYFDDKTVAIVPIQILTAVSNT